ncbi:MAG: hypothetical protein FWG99_08910, partial [Treponema sp.]|nr:hypothetical protein [Treponema sp.]
MKKSAVILSLFMALSGGVFGIDLSPSAGAGGLLGYNFTRYKMEAGGTVSHQSMDRLNYAGFLFFDATYGEFAILIQGGNNNYDENMVYKDSALMAGNGAGTETSLGFSLLGKYPFTIDEKISWFPMFGFEYQISLMQRRKPEGDIEYNRAKGHLIADRDKDDKPYSMSAWNSFWIDVGAGLDYNFAERLFLRSELLFGFRLPTGYELGSLERVKKETKDNNPKLTGLTGGP